MREMMLVVVITVLPGLICTLKAAEPAVLPTASAPASQTARATIDKVVADVLAILRNTKLTKEERAAKVEKIADENMDFETLARLSLGRPWRTLNDAQRKDFTKEFHKFVINTYRHTTDDYTDEDINVTGDRKESDGDVTVLTSVIGTNDNGTRGEVAKVEYRLRKGGENWKIIDVNIAGVSLVANFRSQFSDIISNGNVDKLIRLLHDKNMESEKGK